MAGLKLTQIEGVGPVYADKLLKVGIETTDELLLVDPKRVAKRTGIPYVLLEAWQDIADLIRVSGIGPEYAEALNKVGINSCVELAWRDPTQTLERLRELVEKTGTQVTRRLPSLEDVTDWINQAKTMEPLSSGKDWKEVEERRREFPSLQMLKEIKGSCRGIIKSSWSELEEKTERFIRDGRS